MSLLRWHKVQFLSEVLYLLSGPAHSEDEDEEAGGEQLPDEEDGTEGQVACVAQLTAQVSLHTHTVIEQCLQAILKALTNITVYWLCL